MTQSSWGPDNSVLGLLPAFLPKPFFVPMHPSIAAASFFFFLLQSTQTRGMMVPAPMPRGQPPKFGGSNPVNPERRKPQIFTKETGPAVSCHFLTLASAWPLRAQCTQNYNVITQAGAHSEDSHLGRYTPGAGRHKGHSEAKVTHIYIFSRGGLKYNFNEDCFMDYCLRKLCQRTRENISFPKWTFSSTGVEGNGRKEKAAASIF